MRGGEVVHVMLDSGMSRKGLEDSTNASQGSCTFWTVKVGLMCCCEKANIGFWATLSRYQ